MRYTILFGIVYVQTMLEDKNREKGVFSFSFYEKTNDFPAFFLNDFLFSILPNTELIQKKQ